MLGGRALPEGLSFSLTEERNPTLFWKPPSGRLVTMSVLILICLKGGIEIFCDESGVFKRVKMLDAEVGVCVIVDGSGFDMLILKTHFAFSSWFVNFQYCDLVIVSFCMTPWYSSEQLLCWIIFDSFWYFNRHTFHNVSIVFQNYEHNSRKDRYLLNFVTFDVIAWCGSVCLIYYRNDSRRDNNILLIMTFGIFAWCGSRCIIYYVFLIGFWYIGGNHFYIVDIDYQL
mmetsp:Transcript_19186/g.23762  ORF Transcript_19186/g.23762 Transcript_19186/m.23762 type:complete len:228 (-) Transcript_19186:163-846(-)